MELSEIEQQLQTKGNYQAYETMYAVSNICKCFSLNCVVFNLKRDFCYRNVINNSQDSNADSIDNKNDDVGNIQVYCNKSENLNHSTVLFFIFCY